MQPISLPRASGLALAASLLLAAPAAASGGIWCEGDVGVSIDIASGRLPVLQVLGARAQARGLTYSTGPERGKGEPFVVGQAFAGDGAIMVDFVDPNIEAILVSLRVTLEGDGEVEWPYRGTLKMGDASYPVHCWAE